MSSDNNIPKPAQDGLKSLYKETVQATMAIALRELLALGDCTMALDLTNEESLVNYARQTERANQVIGFIGNKIADDRNMVEQTLVRCDVSETLAYRLTEAGREGADSIRDEVTGTLLGLQAKYARILEDAVASIKNGADN
jgi:hypothetical protein